MENTNKARLIQTVRALSMIHGFGALTEAIKELEVELSVTLGAFGMAALEPVSVPSPAPTVTRPAAKAAPAAMTANKSDSASTPKAAKKDTPKGQRFISEEARQRIAEAQKRRWDKHRAEKGDAPAESTPKLKVERRTRPKSAATPVAPAPLETPFAEAQQPEAAAEPEVLNIPEVIPPPQNDDFAQEFDRLTEQAAAQSELVQV